jgi:hypothetical protein
MKIKSLIVKVATVALVIAAIGCSDDKKSGGNDAGATGGSGGSTAGTGGNGGSGGSGG